MEDLSQWVINQLGTLLHFSADDEIAKCILMIESPRDLEEYLSSLLDMTNPQHKKFVKELLYKKQLHNRGYKKSELENYIQVQNEEKKDKRKVQKSKTEKNASAVKNENNEKQLSKKKPQFTSLSTSEIDAVLWKGRHLCECQAIKHDLIGNCLNCGRIICKQEGSGPCLFCSNLVQSTIPGQPTDRPGQIDGSLELALELRDRLLEYDKSSEKRTRVIDDESDYFSTNSVWLEKNQREALKKKEEELQAIKHSRSRNVIIDFSGRCVKEGTASKIEGETRIIDEVTQIMEGMNLPSSMMDDKLYFESNCEIEPLYNPSYSVDKSITGSLWHNSIGKLQDKQILEMVDSKVCLSMHQPWATLLVSGIKRHEGRSWYTPHRGRLWIAAAAKTPTPEEIEDVKEQYRLIRGDSVKFPSKYPVGCLLGCVNLVDCLAQEEYREVHPDGESDSPFVFICEDPTPCPVLFPMKGKHKLYEMDSKIHQAATKCILNLSKKQAK